MSYIESLCALLWKHKKKILASMAMSLLSYGAKRTYEHFNRPSAEHILESVVIIGEPGGRLVGSGVVMDGGRYVLTVNHVVAEILKDKKPIVITYHDGSAVPANLVRRNTHFDIALLEVPRWHVDGLRLVSDTNVHQGDEVRVFGHPFGITWMVTEGIISKKSYFPPNENGEEFVLWTTAWVEAGNSGGPLVNENGEIIGLVMAFMNPRSLALGATHLNLCVSGSEIIRFLENP